MSRQCGDGASLDGFPTRHVSRVVACVYMLFDWRPADVTSDDVRRYHKVLSACLWERLDEPRLHAPALSSAAFDNQLESIYTKTVVLTTRPHLWATRRQVLSVWGHVCGAVADQGFFGTDEPPHALTGFFYMYKVAASVCLSSGFLKTCGPIRRQTLSVWRNVQGGSLGPV